jgi:hypothetical protein
LPTNTHPKQTLNNTSQTTLDWTCTCINGNTPNFTDYTQTMPFYICQQWIANCVASNQGDAEAQFACRTVVCGSTEPNSTESADEDTPSSTSSASSSSATSGTPTSSGGASSAAATSQGAAAALSVAKTYGTGILATGLLAIFGLAL